MTTIATLCVTEDGIFGQTRRDGLVLDTFSGARIGEVAERIAAARISASFPSHWAAPRRDRLMSELGSAGAHVDLTPIAVTAASFVAEGALRRPKLVVVELGRHATTVTCVMPPGGMVGEATGEATDDNVRIVACEREPALGAEDLLDTERGADVVATLVGLVERVGTGRAVEEILVVAEVDPATLEPFLVGLAKASPRVGRSLVLHPAQICPQPTDERSEVISRRGFGVLGRSAAAASAAVLVLGAAAGLYWWQVIGHRQPAAAEAETVSTVAPAQQSEVTEPNGRARFTVPPAWLIRPVDPQRPGRSELVPDGGAAARVIVIQNEIDPGLGYDEVASALADKIAARGSAGSFADLQRDVVFAGRPGVSYLETPNPGSEVRWHVVVEQATQVSVGCQYPAGDWAAVGSACEKVVRSLTVAPGG